MKRIVFASVLLFVSTGAFAAGPPGGQNVNVVNPSLNVDVQNFPATQNVDVQNFPATQNVNITNDAINVNTQAQSPFCPCFSSAEIDDYLNTSLGTVECNDDRVNQGPGDTARTDIGISATAGLPIAGVQITSTVDDTWSCILIIPSGTPIPDPVVFLRNLGPRDAMACRLAIINSQSWAACPE